MTETGPATATAPQTGVPAQTGAPINFFRTPAVKLFAIGALILLLIIPILMIWALLGERRSRASEVAADISQSWGGPQRLAGPFLVVPYRYTSKVRENDETRDVVNIAYAVFLPDTLSVVGEAKSQPLRRSIFTVPVYRADLMLSGHFRAANPAGLVTPGAEVLWNDAWVAMAVSDVRAFKESVALAIGGQESKVPFEPTIGAVSDTTPGIHAPVPAGLRQAGFDFAIRLVLNGSSRLMVLPFGGETTMRLASNWPHPSFAGAFLPDSRTIGSQGFTAQWTVPNLARSIPQRFVFNDYGIGSYDSSAFGVEFFQSVDFYQLVARSLKYALLFIGVVYLVAFLMEILSDRRLHLVQYLFIGFAQSVFYLLLLSLSEHLGFEGAYSVAGGATILLIAAYSWRALASAVRGFVMFIVLLLVYGLLYLLLRLEDYALLVGSLAVFALLAITMFATLRVDWSGRQAKLG